MSLPDDFFHSVCHLRSAKEIWDTLCVQYEGTAVLMESRKIFLVRQYESFIHQKDETLSQIHQRFNCLLIDLKTIGTIYPNSEVVTKFMEAPPEHWEIYTSCLTMSKDIKTLTLSELYGILLNHEQQKKLKKNLIRDTKDSKSTSLALVSDSVPAAVAATPSSSVTITEIESSDSDMSEDPDFNESLALLTRSFRNFAKKGNFQRRKPLTLTDKPKTESVDKATATCYNCQAKDTLLMIAGKGLIAEDCDWDDVSSDESSDEEDTAQVALMAILEKPTLALMAKIEEVPEEAPTQAPEPTTSATESPSQVSTPVVPLESLTQLDLLTLDLYKALNGKTSAEKMNIDLRDQLKECHEKIKHLTILEENYKDQVSVNQTLCIERERGLATKERALAELNAKKVTIKGWSDASEKVDEILASGRNVKNKKGLGFTSGCPRPDRSMLKFGMFVSSIPDPNAPENIPSSSSNTHLKVLLRAKRKQLRISPKLLKIDLKQKTKEKKPIPPLSNAKGILGTGPAHLKFKDFQDPTEHFLYGKCYHCGLNDHIAIKCPDATKAKKSAKDKGIWYLDSGCSRHMTGSKFVLSDYRDERGPSVTFGGNGKGQTRGYGTLTNGVTTFKRVAYVEGLMHNLLSISQLCDKNHKVSFSKKKCKVKNKLKEVILTGVRQADIYIINMNTSTDNFCFISRASTDTNWLWHKHLSHLNFKTLNQLCINNLVVGLPDFRYTKNFSSVRTPQQNGVAERRNRTLIEAARSMLSEANRATQFWAEAVNTACYTQNRSLIVKRFRRTAYELFRNRKPSIEHLHIFGCVCYILNNKDNLGKFDSKSDDGIFLGYPSISKTYRVFNKRRQTIEEMIHVHFDESGPTFHHPQDNYEINQWADSFFQVPEVPIADPSPQDLPDGFEENPLPPSHIALPPVINATPITQVTPEPDQPTSSEDFSQTTVSEPTPAPANLLPDPSINEASTSGQVYQPPALRWTKDHPIDQVLGNPSSGVKTRHQSGNVCLYFNFISENEPKEIDDALRDPAWVSAMQEELAEFISNNVWLLVPRPRKRTIIGTKWIFRNKLDEVGTIIRNKARLVAQGYRQEEGIDYDETFAPPPGFVDPKFPNHVFKLNKALYGLKQAPRAWYDTLSTFLLSKGFERGKIDSTLFLKKYPKHILLVQIYVDDIIFGSTNPKLCEKFELLMKTEYKMSMMGELTYFLGLQIKQSEKGIFINQGKYVLDMLKKFDLTSCTSMKTPMAPPVSLDKDSKGKPVDVTLYRGMIGSLLYLTASRPDIMYSTCLCARYQAEPKESHLTAVKRIFRYLKGTPNLGLWKSTTGGCHLLGGKLVSWTSKKQNSGSTSTTEAEYVAAGICCAQVLWLRNQLQDYDIQLSKIPIYCDNASAIAIANNPVLHSKTKHIEVRYHFIRDHVMNGDIELHFVPTEYQLADLSTKPLDVTRFNMLISELGIMATTTSTSLDAQLSTEATTLRSSSGNLPVVVPQHDLQFKGNNLVGLFDLPEGKQYLKPAKDFMLSSPLKTAFTINPKSNKPLLLQLWSTAMVAQETSPKGVLQDVIKFQINDEIVSFGIGILRKVLDIPAKKRYPPPPSSEEIIALLDDIGYQWPEKEGVILTKTSATVHKTGLNATFYYIWNTFGLCLTGKTGSTEQFPTVVQNMVFSALKRRKFDYVRHIWDDMVKKVKTTKRVTNVPYTRFFSAILARHMKGNYPTEGTFKNYAIGQKFLDQVLPHPDDVPLSTVLVRPPQEPEQDADEAPLSPPVQDTPAPQLHEPEVVQLEHSENVDGNRSDAVQASGNKSKHFIASSSSVKAFESSGAHLATKFTGSFGAASQGHPPIHQDDPFDEFIFTDSERKLSATELRCPSAERQLQDARAALQLHEDAHKARLQALELELASAKTAAANAEAQAVSNYVQKLTNRLIAHPTL
ncbi:hypothetical protein OSB04_028421 [Centaurea solstitialis]|uniref:CCHC-type domain-containing protein n=1 Tax=Centaurea solstitialis TaxID=347529 RepID=A0AA38ST60_9ASTR|nr:hypothetical protein OSB04_028421 [Centaurea solstitialis]